MIISYVLQLFLNNLNYEKFWKYLHIRINEEISTNLRGIIDRLLVKHAGWTYRLSGISWTSFRTARSYPGRTFRGPLAFQFLGISPRDCSFGVHFHQSNSRFYCWYRARPLERWSIFPICRGTDLKKKCVSTCSKTWDI